MIHAAVAEPSLEENDPDTMSQLVGERERLTKLLQAVRDSIAKIRTEYPYTVKPIVLSPEKTAQRKAELEEIIGQLTETLAAWQAKLEQMLR